MFCCASLPINLLSCYLFLFLLCSDCILPFLGLKGKWFDYRFSPLSPDLFSFCCGSRLRSGEQEYKILIWENTPIACSKTSYAPFFIQPHTFSSARFSNFCIFYVQPSCIIYLSSQSIKESQGSSTTWYIKVSDIFVVLLVLWHFSVHWKTAWY